MVLLIDTFSLFFRAHFALPPMSTSSGEPTGAIYGFSALLLKLLREYPGAELAFALDAPKATFRHAAFDGYKAQRLAAPDELSLQFNRLQQLLDALGVPVFRVPGFEADDVLATLANEICDEQKPGLIVSGDRDLLQVVCEHVRVLFVGRRGKDAVTYDVKAVNERFGVPPERLPTYVALVGDPSDNLPRVPGIGPAIAAKLLANVRDATELLENLEQVQPERVRKIVDQHRKQIALTEQLARLRRDVPLPAGARSLAASRENWPKLQALFEELEFKSLLPRLASLGG